MNPEKQESLHKYLKEQLGFRVRVRTDSSAIYLTNELKLHVMYITENYILSLIQPNTSIQQELEKKRTEFENLINDKMKSMCQLIQWYQDEYVVDGFTDDVEEEEKEE